MRRVSLRNLAAHKVRLFLTVFSVVLGTSFVAGSIVFTSSISGAFSSIFDRTALGVAVQVSPKNMQSSGVPNAVVDKLTKEKQQLGIDRIVTSYTGLVTIADASGKALQTGGAPSVGSAYVPASEAISPDDSKIMPGGRGPENATEVAINSSAAEKGNLKVGSKTKVVIGQGDSSPMEVTVVGLLDLPTDGTGGYVNIQFDKETAGGLFSDGEHVSAASMSAVAGVSSDELAKRVTAAVGNDQLKIQTGDQVRQEQKDQVNQFLDIFNYILLAFAAIGLIVGTFIIYNTFSMIVAQRNRELALLRAVGASRKQVSRSVLLEAFVVGVIGGVVGLGIGIGLAALLQLVAGSTSGLPSGGLKVTPAAILAALFVGIVVTMVSAWVPAARASCVPPVEAMRATQTEGSASLRVRTIIGAVLAVAGIAAITAGATGQGVGPVLLVGGGAAVLIVAVVLGAPALARPVVGGLGRVLAAPFGKVGKLARINAIRNPRRTAATAFALTLGLMLVAIIGTLGSTFKGTVDDAVDSTVTADYIVTGANNATLSPSVLTAVRKVDGVNKATASGVVVAKVGDETVNGAGTIGDQMADVVKLNMRDGASSTVPSNEMIVSQSTAQKKGWNPGTTVTFTTFDGKQVPVKVAAVYDDNETVGGWVLGQGAYEKVMPEAGRTIVGVFLTAKPGTNLDTLRTNLERATSGYLTAQIQTKEEFKSSISSTIDQMLTILYLMLGLALVIAVLGIINTLALSVVERKREIGMLRAIGMVRGQVRRTIYVESVLIAIYGAVLGVLLGCGIGWTLAKTLREWGAGDPVLPWSLIVTTLIGAAVVGVIAALWPAVRAAQTKPLEAIADV
nr:ABC transporter permease [Gordonia effusa]